MAPESRCSQGRLWPWYGAICHKMFLPGQHIQHWVVQILHITVYTIHTFAFIVSNRVNVIVENPGRMFRALLRMISRASEDVWTLLKHATVFVGNMSHLSSCIFPWGWEFSYTFAAIGQPRTAGLSCVDGEPSLIFFKVRFKLSRNPITVNSVCL